MHVLSRRWRICFSRNIVSQLSQVSHFGNSGMMYKTVQVESSKEVNCDSSANTQWMHVKHCSNILKILPLFLQLLWISSVWCFFFDRNFSYSPIERGKKISLAGFSCKSDFLRYWQGAEGHSTISVSRLKGQGGLLWPVVYTMMLLSLPRYT